MQQPVSRFQIAAAILAACGLVVGIAWLALRPQPIRSVAPRGSNPIHYEPEMGPAPGLLEQMKQAGLVPADAIDDGNGHFVSPSRLTPAQREWAQQVVARRAAQRAARSN